MAWIAKQILERELAEVVLQQVLGGHTRLDLNKRCGPKLRLANHFPASILPARLSFMTESMYSVIASPSSPTSSQPAG